LKHRSRERAKMKDRMQPSRRRFVLGASSMLATAALSCRSRSTDTSAAPAPSRTTAASSSPDAAPAREAWDPARTWLFFVGILEFQHSKLYGSFPQDGRKDAELYAKLLSRGVPASQAVFLKDHDATRARIDSALAEHAAKPRPGDTLWLYYAGHGSRDDHGAVGFAPWDADDRDASLWAVTSIFDTIERVLPATRVILTADACHSGELVREAQNRSSRIAYGSMTSSYSREVSTGSWTFTESLIAAMSGDPRLDIGDDGAIDFREAGVYAELEMAFVCGQLAMSGTTVGFPRDLVLSPAGKRDPRIGERIEVKDENGWHHAEVVAIEGDASRVRYVGDDDDDAGKVALSPPLERRAYAPVTFPVASLVEVEWEGKWYDARVKDERHGVHFVHYVGDSASWDEWVGPDRIRAKER
jgi:hypothetical protein